MRVFKEYYFGVFMDKRKRTVMVILIGLLIILFILNIILYKNSNYKISNLVKNIGRAKIYNTVKDMKLDNTLDSNDFCITLGYYEINDGGGAQYNIKKSDGTEDPQINVPLQDENFIAMQIINSKELNMKTLGVRYGSTEYKASNSKIVEDLLIRYKTEYDLFFPKGEVWLGNINFLNAPEDFLPEISIVGEGALQSKQTGLTKIFTAGDDLFFDKRKKSTGISLNAKDIVFKTKEFLVNGWTPKGVCFGSELNDGSGGTNVNIEVNFRFENVEIAGFEYGVYSPNYSCGGSGGDNVVFSMCKYGIYIRDASHLFNISNVSFNYCANGINLGVGGEGNYIKNVHIATGYLGEDKESYDEFVAIYTRGGLTIDGMYFEPYEVTAQSNKQIMIDYEPFVNTYGGKPLKLINCNIGRPGWGSSGMFLRIGCYLAESPGRPYEKKESEFVKVSPADKGHYPGGILEWKESKYISPKAFKELISFREKTEKLLFIGDSIKGNCIPEIYDEDFIMNKSNSIYVSTNLISDWGDKEDVYSFVYNNLKEYVPNHMINKDFVSQTLGSIIKSSIPTKKIKMNGYIEIDELLSNNGQTEFDVYLESNNSSYKHFVGHFKNVIGGSKQVFTFDVEIPQNQIDKYNITEEINVAFYFNDNNKKYIPSTDADKILINYCQSILIN